MSVRSQTRSKDFMGGYSGISIAWRAEHAYPSAARVAELYAYDPATGILFFKSLGKRHGKRAGWRNSRRKYSLAYLIAQIDHKQAPVHRIAWAIMTGAWPDDGFVVDHKNGNGLDNRWVNLRLATPQENARNGHRPPAKTGFRNVHQSKRSGKWFARIYAGGGKSKRLGTFASPEEASKAYEAASIKYFGEFSVVTSRGRQNDAVT